jgi:glycosyltransferase involved in cell wall biosynthesis
MLIKKIQLLLIILIITVCLTSVLSCYNEHFENNPPQSYKYTLSLLVICKNEGMVIDEFIQHYKWQGVEHIYLIDNGSTDNMVQVLASYISEGYVSYYNLPEQHKQIDHYNTVYNMIRNDTRWLIICDADEYIYNRTSGDTILSYLKNINDDICAVVLQWKQFGSSGHIDQPQSIRKSFVWRSPSNTNIKSIVNTINTPALNMHTHVFLENKQQIYYPNELALNHYAIMSEEYFKKVKMNRGDASTSDAHFQTVRDMSYFSTYDHKDVLDEELKNILG